jgi:hypothetical protein
MAAIFPANVKPWWLGRQVGTHHLSAPPWKKRRETPERLERSGQPIGKLRAGGLKPAR